jgi:hypothetical protein
LKLKTIYETLQASQTPFVFENRCQIDENDVGHLHSRGQFNLFDKKKPPPLYALQIARLYLQMTTAANRQELDTALKQGRQRQIEEVS